MCSIGSKEDPMRGCAAAAPAAAPVAVPAGPPVALHRPPAVPPHGRHARPGTSKRLLWVGGQLRRASCLFQ